MGAWIWLEALATVSGWAGAPASGSSRAGAEGHAFRHCSEQIEGLLMALYFT